MSTRSSFVEIETRDRELDYEFTANAPIKDNEFSVYRKSRPNLG
jgi:hypothetical protein